MYGHARSEKVQYGHITINLTSRIPGNVPEDRFIRKIQNILNNIAEWMLVARRNSVRKHLGANFIRALCKAHYPPQKLPQIPAG